MPALRAAMTRGTTIPTAAASEICVERSSMERSRRIDGVDAAIHDQPDRDAAQARATNSENLTLAPEVSARMLDHAEVKNQDGKEQDDEHRDREDIEQNVIRGSKAASSVRFGFIVIWLYG